MKPINWYEKRDISLVVKQDNKMFQLIKQDNLFERREQREELDSYPHR